MDFYKDYYLLPAETASQYYSPIKIRAMSILASKVYWELIDKINKSNSFPYKAYSEKCAAIILGPWLINNVIHRLIDTLQRVSIRETIGTPYKLKTIRLTGHVPSCNFGSGELLGNSPVIQEWMASLVQRNLFVSKEESPILELDFVVKSDFVQENENRHYFLKRGRNFLLNCVARSFHPRTILSSYFYGYTPSLSYKIGASPDNLFEIHPPSVVLSQRKNLSGEILSLSDQASEIIVSYFGNIFPMSNAVEAVSKCLSEIISIFLPVQLFECFDSTISQAESFLRKKNYKALLTSIGFYDRPSYSYLCAVAKKNGVPIFGGQHGGGYGAFQSFSGLTEVEGGIPDYFLTWGWESWDMAYLPSYKNNTRKMPSLKLWLDKKRIRRSARGEYVIFVPTFRQDFIRRFGSGVIPDQVETYVREGVEIIKKLVCDFPVKYKVSHEKGYDNLERRLNIIKPVKVDSGCTKSLRSYFSKAIVVVYDHLSTGTLESITCNIPTLLWLDKKYIAFREEFQIYLDRMEKVGIVKYDVNSFNENFERIKNDIDGWWYSNEVQHVLDDFRENHCHLGERPYKEFCEGLERFISSHPD